MVVFGMVVLAATRLPNTTETGGTKKSPIINAETAVLRANFVRAVTQSSTCGNTTPITECGYESEMQQNPKITDRLN